ncbi:hypothetical protein Cyrtocomes_00846 [Candidatus Cyrtobacter comes]|uniref:Uncharacterized protein n=1 Tax=Candidatus Cyrtobacter comes TaxID=675776 RepID=A0ABU5L8L6_9RICK|nr:hypothetical protein [Candidatus Cyrtobacter comes]
MNNTTEKQFDVYIYTRGLAPFKQNPNIPQHAFILIKDRDEGEPICMWACC